MHNSCYSLSIRVEYTGVVTVYKHRSRMTSAILSDGPCIGVTNVNFFFVAVPWPIVGVHVVEVLFRYYGCST